MTHPLATEIASTGTLRAVINLGNPVLAQGTADAPAGITVDLAREVARRLEVPVELTCVHAAKDSFGRIADGSADLAFLAVDPRRAEEVAFSRPYVTIEGVYVVPADSGLRTVAEVDSPGVRVGVKEGSAYDLHLTRALSLAEIVRGTEGTTVFLEQGLEAGAGIRQPVEALVAERDDLRVIAEAFMQIHQAVGLPRDRSQEARAWLEMTVTELLGSGFVTHSLERSGQDPKVAAG